MQDEVRAGSRGHGGLRLGALSRPTVCRGRPGPSEGPPPRPHPRAFSSPDSAAALVPCPPGPGGFSSALRSRPRPLPGLTVPALRALRPGSRRPSPLLQESDAVAAIGVLAEALPRTLVDALSVANGRPGPAGCGCQRPRVPAPATLSLARESRVRRDWGTLSS